MSDYSMKADYDDTPLKDRDIRWFNSIPVECITQEYMDRGTELLNAYLRGMRLPLGESYLDSAKKALEYNNSMFDRIHKDLITVDLIDLMKPSSYGLVMKTIGDRHVELIDQKIVDHAVTGYLYNASLFDKKFLNDDILYDGLVNNPTQAAVLNQINKLNALDKFVADGFWINDGQLQKIKSDATGSREKPKSIVDAAKNVMKYKDSKFHQCEFVFNKSYLRSHDIKSVIKIMKSPARIRLLPEIYSRDELLNAGVKSLSVLGATLEYELGF